MRRSGQAFWLLHRCVDPEKWSAGGRGAAFATPRPSVGRHSGFACRASQSPRGSDFIAWTEESGPGRDTQIPEFFGTRPASTLRVGGCQPWIRSHDGTNGGSMQVARELPGAVTVDGAARRRSRVAGWAVVHWRLS